MKLILCHIFTSISCISAALISLQTLFLVKYLLEIFDSDKLSVKL